MSVVAAVVVVAFGLSLIALACATFAKPAVAERFLTGFASSPRTHYAEQVFRLLVGTALVARSPTMWQPKMFWLSGGPSSLARRCYCAFRGSGTIGWESGCYRCWFDT